MDQFILFGDSITQQAFQADHGVLGPALADAYVRRLDIVNRGFSGYNTAQALRILPQFMPSPVQARVRLMTIFFGANDSRLPNTPFGPDQHVPKDAYVDHLRAIATHPCVQAHQDIRLIVITPPPVDERKLMTSDAERHGRPTLRRTAAVTRAYAAAAAAVGDELNLPVCDLWTAMMLRTGTPQGSFATQMSLPGSNNYPANPILQGYLRDGLHLSRLGYQVLHEELMKTISETWPDQMPDRLPFVFPAWDDEPAWREDHQAASL